MTRIFEPKLVPLEGYFANMDICMYFRYIVMVGIGTATYIPIIFGNSGTR